MTPAEIEAAPDGTRFRSKWYTDDEAHAKPAWFSLRTASRWDTKEKKAYFVQPGVPIPAHVVRVFDLIAVNPPKMVLRDHFAEDVAYAFDAMEAK